jgi:hypothetical protein
MPITINPATVESFPPKTGYFVVTDVFLMEATVASPDDRSPPEPKFIGTLTGNPFQIELCGQKRRSGQHEYVQILGRGKKNDTGFKEKFEFSIEDDEDIELADGKWESGEKVRNDDDTDYRYREDDTYSGKKKNLNHWAQWMYTDGAEPGVYRGCSPWILYPRVGGKTAIEIAQLKPDDLKKYEEEIADAIADLDPPVAEILEENLAAASKWRETGFVFPSGAVFCDLYQKARLNNDETDPDEEPDPDTLPTLRDWIVSPVIAIPVTGAKAEKNAITSFDVTICQNPSSHPLGQSFSLSTNPFFYPKKYEPPDRAGLTASQMRPTIVGMMFA